MRLTAAVLALVVLVAGVSVVNTYFMAQIAQVANDPAYAVLVDTQLLHYLLVVGVVAVFLLALLIYALLTTRTAARRIAYQMSKDISITKEQFRHFYELSPVPYFLVDHAGLIQRPNKAALRFLGLAEDQLLGKDLFSFLEIPDHNDKLALYRERVAHKVPIEKKEVQVVRPGGEHRWALLSVEDLQSSGAGHVAMVTLVDIHDQKELERIKTEFLSLASHQLRAPLSNLKWYIDFLLSRRAELLNDEVRSYLGKMYQRNEDMIDLVNTLLNLSRVEMGRIKVEKIATDVNTLVGSVVDELTPAAREKELAVQTELGTAPTFETDSRLLRIILQNLLSNAIRYTPKGGSVQVRVTNSGTKLALSVTDTGLGIPPEEQDKIFSKMYRATNARQVEVNGNGIGLYMCKALAESMGGTLTFTSELGHGTTFTLTLSD